MIYVDVGKGWFSPNYTINFAGNAAVEEKVVSEVASYGRQIGWLNEVVLALSEHADLPPHVKSTLQQVSDAVAQIEQIKNMNKQDALTAATNALDRLQAEQPDAYASLLIRRRSGDL